MIKNIPFYYLAKHRRNSQSHNKKTITLTNYCNKADKNNPHL